MHQREALARLGAIAVLAIACVGCSGINSVTIDVASQGSWPVDRQPSAYAIERLPSQQADAAEQERIEIAALPALEAAGFQRVPQEQADVMIQLGARAFEVAGRYGYTGSPFYWRNDWWFHGGRWPFFYGPYAPYGFYGPAYGYGLGGYDFPDVQREVAVLMRDRSSQQFVYETRAVIVSRWTSEALLPALFEAALKDFPQPALSPRSVTIVLPKN